LVLIRSSSSLRLRFALILALVLLAPGLAVPAAAQSEQESEQEGESGETDQSGEVSNEGDNSNQCVAVQPVSNTGNAITAIDIIIQLPTGEQETKRRDINAVLDLIDELDLDLEDVGSTIELSPEQAVECAQAVDQAATASEEDEPPSEDVSGQEVPICAPEWRQEWYPDWASGWWWFQWFQDCYTDQHGWYRVYDGWDWGPSIW
jgi:hypothetical protein